MKTETREIYKCDYCNKIYQVKNACMKHEKRCYHNPDNNRDCHDCWHLEKVSATCCGEEREVEVFYCSKKDCHVYPPSVTEKNNALVLDKENIEMPRECDLWASF